MRKKDENEENNENDKHDKNDENDGNDGNDDMYTCNQNEVKPMSHGYSTPVLN